MAATDELKDLLREDIRQLDMLADILKQEKACLAASDISALDSLTRDKNSILDQIRDRARQKVRLLVAMGFRPQSGSPSRFIRSSGLTEIATLWENAESNLTACQAMNSTNGRVLSHLQKRLARLTDIFRGATGQQKLYGAHGEQTSVSHRSILASA